MKHGTWAFLAACICAPVAAAPGAWSTSGPDGGTVNHLAVDPLATDTLMAVTRAGVFRSSNGGGSWHRFEDGLAFQLPYGFAIADNGSMFIAPNHRSLARSAGGSTWSPLALAIGIDDAIADLSIRGGSDQFIAVASLSGVHVSSDGGASFAHAAGAGLPATSNPVRIEAASGSRLYVTYPTSSVPAQVFRSDDNGATFAPTAALPGFETYLPSGAGDLEAAPGNADIVYLAASAAVFRSGDGGATWAQCAAVGDNLQTLHVSPTNPDVLWLAHGAGLASSADGCASWTQHSMGLSSDGVRTDAFLAVAPAPGFPADARVWAGSEHGGVFRSTDGGATFAAANDGLVGTNIRAIAVQPDVPGAIFAGYGDAMTPSGTLFRSVDDGASWSRANAGLRATQVRGLTIDPTTASDPGGAHMYAVGSSRSGNAAPTPANTDGGIYKSVDGGTNWTTIDAGLPNGYFGTRFIGTVRNLVLDPRSCLSPPGAGACTAGPLQTAYITASGLASHATGVYTAARVYKSTNAGMSWTASDAGLPAPSLVGDCHTSQIAVPLVIDPTSPDTLYVGLTLNAYGDSCATPTVANGIFKSTDGGATWTHASNGLARIAGAGSSHYSVLALAIDPTDPDVLYAGGYRDLTTVADGRVFKSIDGGSNWTEISVGIAGADVRALLVDPDDARTIYAAVGGGSLSDPGGVYRSTDGGLTWNSFSIGLPPDAATALAIDPHTPGRLLAGTIGGLWEFTAVPDPDSDGAATSIEDAAPNAGDANDDGVADAAQSHVASFGAASTNAPAKGTSPHVTLDVAPIDGNCTRINNAHALAAEQLPPDTARGVAAAVFDRGVLRFELPDCRHAQVTVRFHGADHADIDWSWRNYGPTVPGDAASLAWYAFEGAQRIAPDTWVLDIDAAARGNYRAADDAILFVGAPGFVDIHLFGDGME